MTVQGEDVIWLLEDSPLGRRLYELGRSVEEVRDTTSGHARLGVEGTEDLEEEED